MRSAWTVVTAVAAASLLLGACSARTPAPEDDVAAGPPSARVRVGLVEWGFTTSARALVAGPVVLTVTNAGSTPHDMQVVVDGDVLTGTRTLRPGEQQTVRADLTGADTATLRCTLPGHEAQGMAQQIDVVDPSATADTGRQTG